MSFESLIHASDNIVASLLYLLICLITIFWLMVVYFNKKRKKSIRGSYFKVILFTIIVLLVSNAAVILFLFAGVGGIPFRILYTIHWECFIFWFGTYRVYNILFLSGAGEEEWSDKNHFKKLYTGLPVSKKIVWNDVIKYLAMVIYLFIPYKMMDVNHMIFIDGIATYYVIAYMFISGGISLFLDTLIVYKKEYLINYLLYLFT